MDNKPKVQATSHKMDDGRLAEMTYDPAKEETVFIVGIDNKTEIKERLDMHDKHYLVPLEPSDKMIKAGFIKFPSKMGSYGSAAKLFEEIKTYIKKYSMLPDDFVTIASLYIMMTWVYEKFHTIPYLRVIGMHGTGKTRFLEVVGNACYKPMMAGGSVSTAAVFRVVDKLKGTLVLDEADFRQSELWSEIIKILNAGHTSDFPAIRMEPKIDGGFDIKTFYVFGPKVLASRVRFNDEALESRCLTQNLLPQPEVKVPIHLTEEFRTESLELRNKLLAFRFLNYNSPVLQEQNFSGVKFPRLKQSMLAIVNISRLIGKETTKEVIDFGLGYEADLQIHQAQTIESDVLICILELLLDKSYMDRDKGFGRIRVGDIAHQYDIKFNSDFDDKERKEYSTPQGSGGPFIPKNYRVSPRKIGFIIQKLQIKPQRDSEGFFIPKSEHKKIMLLKKRYGITDEMLNLPVDEENHTKPLEI